MAELAIYFCGCPGYLFVEIIILVIREVGTAYVLFYPISV